MARYLWKFEKPPYARLSSASAGDLDRSPRCDRQLSKPIDDLSILCWDLKALPTHHLPWAGFGLRQPQWLIQKYDVEKSRIVDELEKKQTDIFIVSLSEKNQHDVSVRVV